MSNLIYRTADKCLLGQPTAFITAGAYGVDRISVELDETWTGLGDEQTVEYALSINPPGEYDRAGAIVLNERSGDVVSCKIPYDVTAKAAEWEVGLLARDVVRGEFLKTSTTVPLIVKQGAPPTDTYIRDWEEIRQELIYKINAALGAELPETADADDIIEAIGDNPKVKTVSAWDKLFAGSPLGVGVFGSSSATSNKFWKGSLPHLNTVNLIDARRFFACNYLLDEVSFDCSNVTNLESCFRSEYAPSAILKKVTLKNLTEAVTNFGWCFGRQGALTEIDADFDFTNCTNTKNMFTQCNKLNAVRFVPDSLSISLDFTDCSALSRDSVISALRACRQLETAGSAVMSFNTAVYNAELMTEIEAAVAKGFKVTFGNRIYGGTEE